MKKLFLAAVAALVTAFSANAQVKIESPHPDLDIKITRCAYASGTVVIDMVLTNFGPEESLVITGSTNKNTTAYDDEGNQYTDSNSAITLGLLSQGLGRYDQTVVLPQDIPLKFRVQVTKVSAEASKFSLLKIAMASRGAMALKADKPLQIRNLEWVK